jgi:putative oxidoreductase
LVVLTKNIIFSPLLQTVDEELCEQTIPHIMKKTMIADIISALLLLLFVYTAISKLITREAFEFVLFLSPSLREYAVFLSWALPVTELVVCVLLFLPATRLAGVYASGVLLLLFTLYLVWMLLFTSDRPCQCGGVLSSLSWPQHIIFNLFFLVLSVTGMVLYKKHPVQRTPT